MFKLFLINTLFYWRNNTFPLVARQEWLPSVDISSQDLMKVWLAEKTRFISLKWDLIALRSASLFPKTFIIMRWDKSTQFLTNRQWVEIMLSISAMSFVATGLFSNRVSKRWPAGSIIRTKCCKKWKSNVKRKEHASKMFFPDILGNWQQSPFAITSAPPNESFEFFIFLKIKSIAQKSSAGTRLTSSKMRTCNCNNKLLLLWSWFNLTTASLAKDSASKLRTEILNKRCMCSPRKIFALLEAKLVTYEIRLLYNECANAMPVRWVLPVPGFPIKTLKTWFMF